MSAQVYSKLYWERAVEEIEIRAARFLHVPDTKAASAAAERFHFTYAPSWWDWSTHHTTYIQNAPIERAPRDEAQERADRAKWIGVIVSAIAAAAAGFFVSSFSKAREALHVTEGRLEVISCYDHRISLPVSSLLREQRHIDERNYANAQSKLLSATVLLAGGVSAVAGGFMVSSALITAGYVTMIFGTLALLFSVGRHWSDEAANRENAYAIVGCQYKQKHVEGLAEIARRELCCYNDQMERQREEGEQEYVPLYGERAVPHYTPTCAPSAPFEVEGATT